MLRKLTEFVECTGTSKAYRDTYLRTPKSRYTGIQLISRTPSKYQNKEKQLKRQRKLGLPGGGTCSPEINWLVPWFPKNLKFVFLYSLFPNTVFVPCSPQNLTFCSPVPLKKIPFFPCSTKPLGGPHFYTHRLINLSFFPAPSQFGIPSQHQLLRPLWYLSRRGYPPYPSKQC